MRLVRFLGAAALAASICVCSGLASAAGPIAGPPQDEIRWNFSFSEGGDEVTGQFTTSGTLDDLAGSGLVDFAVTGLLSYQLNGASAPVAIAVDPNSADGTLLRWNRSTQQVDRIPNAGVIYWSSSKSGLNLSYSTFEFGSSLFDYQDDDPQIIADVPVMIWPELEPTGLAWSFVFETDDDTVTGDFVTNGSVADLSGSGLIDFAVTELRSIFINGVEPDLAVALDPDAADGDLLRWDRAAGSVASLPVGAAIDWTTGSSDFYLTRFSFEFSPVLVDRTDFAPSVTLAGPATIVSLPEPGMGASGLAVLGAVGAVARVSCRRRGAGWRRVARTQQPGGES